MKPHTHSFFSTIATLAVVLLSTGLAAPLEHLEITTTSDTSYLPYRCVEYESGMSTPAAVAVERRFHLWDHEPDSTGQQRFLVVRNGNLFRGMPAIISLKSFPSRKLIDDTSLRLSVKDCELFYDTLGSPTGLAMLGYQNDTVFLACYHPDLGIVGKLAIASGRDNTGSGAWIPNITIVTINDFDTDGKNEAIICVFTERDLGPRAIYCIELETLTLEWSFPTASGIRNSSAHIQASADAGVQMIFVTGNPGHGRIDENYQDSWGYLSAVSTSGELLFNYVIKLGAVSTDLIRSQRENTFYLLHEIMPTAPETVHRLYKEDRLDDLKAKGLYLSKIDQFGHVIHTTELPCGGYSNFWLQPYGPEGEISVYVHLSDRRVLVLDTALTEIAISDTVRISNHLTSLTFDGHENAQVFTDGIYTSDLTKLLSFPRGIGEFIPISHDSLGNITGLALGGSKYFWIGRIEKKSLLDLISVFYLNNQNYVLAILSCLVGGLLVTNFYRRRNKQNYRLIAKQKEELTRTHQELREAQGRLVAHEKDRQARDIAGGFSHEIRNALFPAQAGLKRLRKTIHEDASHEAADKIERAINRGIEMTKLITRFTRLGSDFVPKPTNISAVVNMIMQDNETRITDQQVNLQITGSDDITVLADDSLLYILMNNLILNSLDALENRTKPKINVGWTRHTDYTEIVVEDNGVGIDKKYHSRIFDAFYSSKPQSGTGIGLTMVRRIVDLCNGEVSVHSTPGKGTSIQVYWGYTDTPDQSNNNE